MSVFATLADVEASGSLHSAQREQHSTSYLDLVRAAASSEDDQSTRALLIPSSPPLIPPPSYEANVYGTFSCPPFLGGRNSPSMGASRRGGLPRCGGQSSSSPLVRRVNYDGRMEGEEGVCSLARRFWLFTASLFVMVLIVVLLMGWAAWILGPGGGWNPTTNAVQ